MNQRLKNNIVLKSNKSSQSFSNYISLKSYSKLNFALWIKGKRADNYHQIETIFFENSNLYDDIEICLQEGESLLIDVSFIQDKLNKTIPKDKNLAYCAAMLFFKKLGFSGKCRININKKISLEAGLGGGSSNAACVLKGLNQLFDYQLHESELLLLAGQIGSDVPFFILGGTCLGKGRGEILNKLDNKLNLDIKVICPKDVSISTKWAYEQIDFTKTAYNHKSEINNLVLAMKRCNYDLFFKNVFNDFENVVFSKYPVLLMEKKKLLDEGFSVSTICGSGSALFGVRKKA